LSFVLRIEGRLVAALVAIGGVSVAVADVGLGSRSAGMGGVGLALPGDPVACGRLNPAAYGLAPTRFRFGAPQLGLREQNLTFREAKDLLDRASSGGVSADTAKKLLQTFAGGDRGLGFIGAGGFGFGGFEVSTDLQAGGLSRPNATLQLWDHYERNVLGRDLGDPNQLALALVDLNSTNVNVQGQTVNFRDNAAGDVYGYGFYSINLAYGAAIPTGGGHPVAVGVRGRIVRGYYTHRAATGGQIATAAEIPLSPEMGGVDVRDKSGFGLDLGVLAQVGPSSHVGLVVENLLRPRVGMPTISPWGPQGQPGVPGTVNPFHTTVSVGFGQTVKPQTGTGEFVYGVDWYDLGNASGGGEARFGAEYRWGVFAVRAGYGTRLKGSVGFSLLGVDVNFSKEMPATMVAAFRF